MRRTSVTSTLRQNPWMALGILVLLMVPAHSRGLFLSTNSRALKNLPMAAAKTLPEPMSIGSFTIPTLVASTPSIRVKKGVTYVAYPFLVSLVNSAGTVLCGGVLISKTTVLTAASCVDASVGGLKAPTVIANSVSGTDKDSNSQILEVVDVQMHPDWHAGSGPDLAILFLGDSSSKSPVQLPSSSSYTVADDTQLVMLGYGRLSSSGSNSAQAQEGKVAKEDPEMCELVFGKAVTSNQICVSGASGSCSGDTGGPIVKSASQKSKSTLVAIVGTMNTCGGAPVEVHTAVAPSVDWIKETAGL